MLVELHVRGGGLVAKAHIPPFQVLPKVLYWGSRVFVLDPEQHGAIGALMRADETVRYEEACAWHLTGEINMETLVIEEVPRG